LNFPQKPEERYESFSAARARHMLCHAACGHGVENIDRTAALFMSASPHIFEFLDIFGLCSYNSVANICRAWGAEVEFAKLRAGALRLLTKTKFPFTHSSYVLGLNGQHYSFDTNADRHYGIPSQLPAHLCRLFHMSFPDVDFTTVRIQKFSASLNFGGKHKTLPFSVGYPPAVEADQFERKGYVFLITEGCIGGYGELCDDLGGEPDGQWVPLAQPSRSGCWALFPIQSWLRWYWPQAGQFFVITVTCEMPENCRRLRRRERCAMAALGFKLPAHDVSDLGDDSGSGDDDAHSDEECQALQQDLPRMPGQAQIHVALKLLRFGVEDPLPDARTLDDRFRAEALKAHPDRAITTPPDGNHPHTWSMERLLWARRILRTAAAADAAMEVAALATADSEGANGALVVPTVGAPPAIQAIEDDAVGL